jgi:4-oxalocrotonate tautomerase
VADNGDSSTGKVTTTRKEKAMPYVNVKVIENVFSPEEKAEMIHGITEAVVAVEGEGVRNYTVVVLEEVRSGDWAFGGQRVSTADVHALRGSAPLSATG